MGGLARAPLPRHPERACERRAYLLFVGYAATTGGSDGGHSELSTDSIESRKIESLLVPLNRRHKVGSKAWFAEISRDSAIVTPFYPVGGWSGSVNQAFPWVYGAGAPVLGCPRETCMKMQTALRSPANFITERNGTVKAVDCNLRSATT